MRHFFLKTVFIQLCTWFMSICIYDEEKKVCLKFYCVYYVVGGSRYIPGAAGGEANARSAADPFTGSSRYVPGGGVSPTSG